MAPPPPLMTPQGAVDESQRISQLESGMNHLMTMMASLQVSLQHALPVQPAPPLSATRYHNMEEQPQHGDRPQHEHMDEDDDEGTGDYSHDGWQDWHGWSDQDGLNTRFFGDVESHERRSNSRSPRREIPETAATADPLNAGAITISAYPCGELERLDLHVCDFDVCDFDVCDGRHVFCDGTSGHVQPCCEMRDSLPLVEWDLCGHVHRCCVSCDLLVSVKTLATTSDVCKSVCKGDVSTSERMKTVVDLSVECDRRGLDCMECGQIASDVSSVVLRASSDSESCFWTHSDVYDPMMCWTDLSPPCHRDKGDSVEILSECCAPGEVLYDFAEYFVPDLSIACWKTARDCACALDGLNLGRNLLCSQDTTSQCDLSPCFACISALHGHASSEAHLLRDAKLRIGVCVVLFAAFVGQTWPNRVDQVRGTMAENSDQELPDFDGDMEDCNSQLDRLVLSEPRAEENLHTVNVEEIPSDDGAPKIWIDQPCKTEEDVKMIETAIPVDHLAVADQRNKGEKQMEQPPPEGEQGADLETKQEAPTVLESAPPATEPLAKEETQPPLDPANRSEDTEMTPADVLRPEAVAESTVVTEGALNPTDDAHLDEQRRHEDNGRVHLGMALQDIISDSTSMKEVLRVAAERVGRANAKTAQAKSDLRLSLTKGAEQAWISLWHVVFRSRKLQTQSIKELVEAHKAECKCKYWDLNEAFFNAFHTMQSTLSSLTEVWDEVQALVEMTKNKAKQVWEAILQAANLPSRADINRVTLDKEGRAIADVATGSGSAGGSAPVAPGAQTPSKAMPPCKPLAPPPPKPTGDTSDSEEEEDEEPTSKEGSRARLKSRRTAFSPETQYATFSRFGLLERIERRAKRRRTDMHAPWSGRLWPASDVVDTGPAAVAPWRDGGVVADAVGIPPPPLPRRVTQ
eukprot:176496-Amphidinium_carterae.1